MNRTHFKWLAAVLLLAGAQQAFAEGTLADTTITNTATVDYEVGGVAQTATGDAVEFEVDRRIDVTVAEVGGANTSVSPGADDQVLTFTVENTTNDVMDFRLTAANGDGADAPDPGTDNFDPDNIRIFVESGTTTGYQPAEDTETFIDELAADGIATVYVISDISSTQEDGDLAAITLTATAADGGTVATLGADATEDTGADDPALVQNVFGDEAGDTDAEGDGQHSDTDAYEVASATIDVTKTSFVISDPFNDETNPKAIPGAVILYCIEVANTGGTDATDVSISDPIPANTTYVDESIEIFTGTASIDCDGGDVNTGTVITDAEDTDAGDSGPGGDDTEVRTTVATLPDTDGVTTTIFRVTVD